MPQPPDHLGEMHARLVKTLKLADFLERHCSPEYLADAIADGGAALMAMPDEWWQQVADSARCRIPSETTRREVVKRLAKRIAERDADPFEGLGSGPEPQSVQFVGCDA